MPEKSIKDKCLELQSFWTPRNDQFKVWYKLLQMVDELKQENMESFVGNDPRSAYNLLVQMLNQEISHRFPPELITQELVTPAGDVANIFNTGWKDIHYRFRQRGEYWSRKFIGLLVATGWYSVFATMTIDGSRFVAEIWNPSTVFPAWDDELIECSHIFSMSEKAAVRMAARNGWTLKRHPQGEQMIYDYWAVEDMKVLNGIVMGDEEVKPITHEPRFSRIPIFVGPVGGLPDTGVMAEDKDIWKKEIGQGFMATNVNIYKYWNKWWTFTLQLLRDTAQARTWEKSRSSEKIIKPEEWDKRGGHFKMTPEESIGFVEPPPIPIEIRSAQLDMEAMMQRGGPSWSLYGDIRQQVSSYVMSQIAASAKQLTDPYHQGIMDCLADIDNFWLGMIRQHGYKPYGLSIPKEIPTELKLITNYDVKVPGDFVQRATAARMLDPAFELSPDRIMAEFFPEITNPIEEMAKVQAAKAKRHPVAAIISLISSFREQAEILRNAGDPKAAQLYDKAAEKTESMLEIAQEETGEGAKPPPGANTQSMPPDTQGIGPQMASM